MIVHRIVEQQAANAASYRTTDSIEEYHFIEELIEQTKPPLEAKPWHFLIATPFRYPTPVPPNYSARFKPPFHAKNAFYAAENPETCAFETCYHWLRQRVHLKGLSRELEPRALFTVDFNDPLLVDISTIPNLDAVMSRGDYTASHLLVIEKPEINSIRYPSCRDPERRHCIATFGIKTLGFSPLTNTQISFQYLEEKKACRVINLLGDRRELIVAWEDVA